MKIEKPGIYDIPMDVYHSDCCPGPSVSSSGLRKIHLECPADYWAFSYLNPEAFAEPDREAFAFGRAAHALLVGGDDWSRYAVRPRKWDSWRTKAAKEWREEQIDAHRTVITEADLTIIMLMARVLEKHPMTPTLLEGRLEQSLIWQDEETGIWLKTRPDVIPNFDRVVVDYKSTTSIVQPYKIQREIVDRGYFMQMALIEDGLRILADMTDLNMVLLFQMKQAPFHVVPYEVDAHYLEIGRDFNRKALRTMAACLESGEWPGYVEGIPVAHPPQWLVEQWQQTTVGT